MNLSQLVEQLTRNGIELWPDGDQLRYRAAEHSVTPELLTTLKRHKTEIIAYLQHGSTRYPLSFGQKALWFEQQMQPTSFAYNVSIALHIHSPVDLSALQQAFQRLVNRHSALRTIFPLHEGQPVQQIYHHQDITLTTVDADGWSDTRLKERVKACHEDPFALAEGPLFRLTLFTLREDEHLLLWSLHHLLCDGWSLWLMLGELRTLYAAMITDRPADLPILQATYADYVAWQAQMLAEKGEKLWHFWQQQLAGELPLLDLPIDRPRPRLASGQGASQPIRLSEGLTAQLTQLAQREGVTLYMLLLAAFQVLLHRYTHQNDILVGSPMVGRSPEFEAVVGYFVSPVVIRSHLAGDLPFCQLLRQVQQTVLAAFEHQDMPFGLLVERLHPQRDTAVSPIYQAMFALHKSQTDRQFMQLTSSVAEPIEFAGLQVSSFPLPQFEGQFDLYFELFHDPANVSGAIKYHTDLFDASTIERMVSHYQVLLQGIVANPNQPIAHLPLLTAAECQQLLVEWNNTATDYPKDKTIHQLFEEQVERTPDAVAVVMAENQKLETGDWRLSDSQSPISNLQSLTYQELNEWANQLAHYLQTLGVGPEVLVGLCVERSLEMVVGLLAILKAGGVYVPLDPSYPAERLAFMLQETQTPVLLTQARLLGQLPSFSGKTLCFDQAGTTLASLPTTNPAVTLGAEGLAYVMYTSGSSGQAKGISVVHQNVVRLVKATDFMQMGAEEVFLQLASLSFDAATLEIWSPLLNGGRLVVAPPHQLSLVELGTLIRRYAVSSLWLTAGLFHLMVDACLEDLRPLRQLLAGGDVLSPTHVQRVRQAIPSCRLINGYGPTENTTFTCCYTVPSQITTTASVPIGRPIANTQVYILDAFLQPVPIGVFGELYAGGDGVARGYYHHPALTTEKFIENPFGRGRLYKTGDRCRWLADGNIEFLGRIDQQVKVRGFRIELGEIETVLCQHPDVQEAVVIAQQEQIAEKHLVAYLVAGTADGAMQQAYVEEWQSLYADTYSQPTAQADLRFNLSGWQSSYTGQPIPEAEMAEWVAHTVAEIASLQPQRVLEIGCGTGLLLSRLAPDCAVYVGTDYSQQAIEHVQRLRTSDDRLSHVQLAQRMADDLSDFAAGSFDCVVLNSIVQYFPSVDYLLRVLEGAVRLVQPGGSIYVGDVRNYRLIEAYHTSVQRYQAEETLPLGELHARIQQHMQDEEELLIDPAFFQALPQHLPQIAGVQMQLKRGMAHNELTRFRYQVVLRIAEQTKPEAQFCRVNEQAVRWSELGGTLQAVQQLLQGELCDGTVVVRNIPNARLQQEAYTLQALSEQQVTTVAQLRQQVCQHPSAIEPAALWQVGEALGYEVQVMTSNAVGEMEARFRHPQPNGADGDRFLPPVNRQPWSYYTNNPLLGKVRRILLPQVRSFLQSKLPDYMIPSAFVLLDRLPLTPNGKVDRKALPAPFAIRRHADKNFIPPRSETERLLASIWCEVLGIQQVGIHDNFFDLGGHSLLATQVVSSIRQMFAIDLPLRTLFAEPTVAASAEAVTRLQLASKTQSEQSAKTAQILRQFPAIVAEVAQRYEPFPLTDVQHAYWVGRANGFELSNISAHAYFELDAIQLDGERLNQAWQFLITRHEMLRAIIQNDGQQRILEHVPTYHFRQNDLTTVDEAERLSQLAAVRAEMSHQLLPADCWPLFDIRLTHLSSVKTRIHVSLDALILDGASLGILFREWMIYYHNLQPSFEPLTVSFRDYVLAEKAFAQGPFYQQAWHYWQKRMETLPPAPELPLRINPQQLVNPQFQTYTFTLEAKRWAKLKERGSRAGLTASTVILSAFAELLARWSKRPHFTLNLTLFNRLPFHPQIHQVVGDFTPLLMLEVDGSTGNCFRARSQCIQQQLWDDLDHRVVNGVRVLRELAKRQGLGMNRALMPVVFTSMLATEVDFASFAGLGEMVYAMSQTPQVWLDHGVTESQGALQINWSVVEELFPDGMISEMFATYCHLLERLAEDEQTWDVHQPVALPDQQLAQREAVNTTQAPIAEEMLHTLFLPQVAARASQPAVITTTRTLSYQELYARANQVGHWLVARGVQPNQLVGVVMEKGWEQVVAVLGIHLAGAAYLPIDAHLPVERQHYLLTQGEVKLAFIQSRLAQTLALPAKIESLMIDELPVDSTLPALPIRQQPTDLAYVIYTSGSTGQPKGVMIDHRGAVNTILDINRRLGVTAQDRVLALSALNFDLSVYDIFGLLAVGGVIVLPDPDRRNDPDHWLELMSQHGVTLWDTVPALMQMLVDTVESRQGDKERGRQGEGMIGKLARRSSPLAPLRLVMLSGDWIPVTLPDRIQACWADVTVYGLGGATEASIWSNYFLIEAVDPTWPSIPYGKPLTNQSFQVLDTNLNPRPVWAPGDLYIGGIGLALGYWKDEEKTQAKFIIHPQTGERLYKTGDLARYLPDGNLEFLGREDFQVKIRGHRIELGEIENALLQYPGIKEAVVNALGDPKGHRQLVGYVVLDHNAQESLDVIPVGSHGTITDPINRLEFKLRQPAIRQQLENQPIALLTRPFDESRRHDWLARQSYRCFLNEGIPLEAFSDFLSCLQQMPLENAPLPKYRYPSAGNLYPVQTYLYVKAGRIEGLAGGTYYYHPVYHQLVPLQVEEKQPVGDFQLGAANQTIFAQAAFALFLVGDLAAIAPLYGEIARDFALLEAGYMSQLLMMQAPQHELGLCPIGGVDRTLLQSALALEADHQLLHCLAGGRIDPCQMRTWLQPTGAESTGAEKSSGHETTDTSWSQQLQKHLAQKLPDYMIPTAYLFLDALPLTPNGKVDRKALPLPDLTIGESKGFTPPCTATEQILADLWSTLLGVQQVGIHDDFFTLGGDSLILTQLRTRLCDRLQIDLPLRTFFEKNTIADFATYIDAHKAAHTMAVHPSGSQDQLNTDVEEEIW